jgi:hypothetical protein
MAYGMALSRSSQGPGGGTRKGRRSGRRRARPLGGSAARRLCVLRYDVLRYLMSTCLFIPTMGDSEGDSEYEGPRRGHRPSCAAEEGDMKRLLAKSFKPALNGPLHQLPARWWL